MIFIALSLGSGLFVMIGYYTFFPNNDKEARVTTETMASNVYNYSAYGMCQEWIKKGDGFCDDEANVELCDYDEGDCCDLEHDRTLCTECFCFVHIAKIEEIVKCQYVHNWVTYKQIKQWSKLLSDHTSSQIPHYLR